MDTCRCRYPGEPGEPTAKEAEEALAIARAINEALPELPPAKLNPRGEITRTSYNCGSLDGLET